MGIRNLDKIFRPQRIAVIGASERENSVGWAVQHNLIAAGFPGVVYPVNPNRAAVQGLQAYPDVGSLPKTADLAIICTPAPTVPAIVQQCGEAGIPGLIILAAGFRESGDEGKQLEQQVAAAARPFESMRIIGPNSLGVIVPRLRLNASFAPAMPATGQVAFVSQSGALGAAVLDWAEDEAIGFSFFVSIGNMLDVGFGDVIDYIATDRETESILIYAESITEPRDFMSSARAFSRTKPIIAYKAGRYLESARVASSHTGAMAGEDAVYDAAFRRAGIERVTAIDDMFDCAELLAHHRRPEGPNLAIVTNAGAPAIMAMDTLLRFSGSLATLTPASLKQLDTVLPPHWSRSNPLNVRSDADADRYAACVRVVLKDPTVHAVLVILSPQAWTAAGETATAIARCAERTRKPILACWMGGVKVQEGIRTLNQYGIPTYSTPEKAVDAFMHLVSYARNQTLLYETPQDVPVAFDTQPAQVKDQLRELVKQPIEGLSEIESKRLLAAYGIATTKPLIAASADEAVERAREIGYPVVMKIRSPDIAHKTDVGGVAINLLDDASVRREFDKMLELARVRRPDATIEGVSVQRMMPLDHGVELILGSKLDRTFGSVIMVGTGGITAEVLKDRAIELPPLNERLARRMLQQLRSWPLLNGFRGRPAVQLDALVETMIRFSYLVANHPEILEMDVNPLLAHAGGVIALDARVIVDRQRLLEPPRAFAHLAIRPYPDEFVTRTSLRDGSTIVLRPIKPEDEPMWHTLLTRCSPESIRSRFRYLFKRTTHEMATRFCYIDYDREMAIVAEHPGPEGNQLVGVGRLVADPDMQRAEYAILVIDAWQGKGLGTVLTRYCLQVARSLGWCEVYAETLPENTRMISLFRKCGFTVAFDAQAGVVGVRCAL